MAMAARVIPSMPGQSSGPIQQFYRRQESYQGEPRSRSLHHESHLSRASPTLVRHFNTINLPSEHNRAPRKNQGGLPLLQQEIGWIVPLNDQHASTVTTATSSLTSKDHYLVVQYLQSLNNQELSTLGGNLGLNFSTLKKKSPDSLLNEMVNAWLRRDDDVMARSGNPSWDSLCQALQACGHNGIVDNIRQYIEEESLSQPIMIVHSESTLQEENDTDAYDPYEDCRKFRLASAENSPVVKECNLMNDHVSYHGAITGKEAEQRLKTCGDHCYLTRYSEARECYMLTIYKKQPQDKVKHFQITFEHSSEQNVYKIDGKTNSFSGINEMLTNYEQQRIDPALETIGRSITEREYMEAKFTADRVKQQALEEALQETGLKYQQVKLQLEEVEQERQKLKERLQAVEQQRREDVARAKKQCCCTIL